MKYLDLSLSTPAANLACDEALLDQCERGEAEELLRIWESTVPFVVIGYSNHAPREVHLRRCQDHQIPILRRCSGGGTVVQGPGCLNYSLCLEIASRPMLGTISGTNRFIMEEHRRTFARLLRGSVAVQGHTDLTVQGRKFSGNAQRRKRRFLLFHGTVLLNFDLTLIGELLPLPSKQPDYRKARDHAEFLVNVQIPPTDVKQAWRQAWGAEIPAREVPTEDLERLVKEKYGREDWNLRLNDAAAT